MELFIYIFYSLFLLLVGVLGFLSLYVTLYVWEDPKRLKTIASPQDFLFPQKSFSVLIPARHEEKVIGQTLLTLAKANYPKNLIEIYIICEENDLKTIHRIQQTIITHKITNTKILTFNDGPINKPHALNKGLLYAQNDIVAVFDAEDEISPNIFHVANTLFMQKNPDVLQAGVQLINYASRWYSVHNVLEYYLWFKSRMHFHTKVGMVPLGGNTVFFKTKLLRAFGGWKENCLTEDAEIGIRLSAAGATIISTYDPTHVTKEETPATISQFIKQRTRWNQGFLQILVMNTWTNYDSFGKRILSVYTLAFPIIQTFLFVLTPTTVLLGLDYKLPIVVSLISFIPLMLVITQYIINTIALREFIQEQKLPEQKIIYFTMLFTFIPYQMLLAISALRATFREMLGLNNWEKTFHTGEHREFAANVGLNPEVAL
jgi:cellulose synthase/poly-beta-1,6-N-acetylglucosamine synthase-like glycosyltransferase